MAVVVVVVVVQRARRGGSGAPAAGRGRAQGVGGEAAARKTRALQSGGCQQLPPLPLGEGARTAKPQADRQSGGGHSEQFGVGGWGGGGGEGDSQRAPPKRDGPRAGPSGDGHQSGPVAIHELEGSHRPLRSPVGLTRSSPWKRRPWGLHLTPLPDAADPNRRGQRREESDRAKMEANKHQKNEIR